MAERNPQQLQYNIDKPVQVNHHHHHHHRRQRHRQPIYLTSTPDGGWGWVVIFATFLVFFFTLGFKTSLGVFYVHWERYFDVTKTQISWVTSLSPLVIAFVSPFAAGICYALGPRIPVMFGGIVAATGMLASSYSENIFHLMATIGVISAVGMGFTIAPSIVVLHHYFEKRFVVANGIAFAGISCGELIYPLIIPEVIDAYGWRGALFIMAAVELNLVVCGGVMIRSTYPWMTPATTVNVTNEPSGSKSRRPPTPNFYLETMTKSNVDSEIAENKPPDEVDTHRIISRQESSISSVSSVSSSSLSSFVTRPRFLSEPRKSIALFMFGPQDQFDEHEIDRKSELLSGESIGKHEFSTRDRSLLLKSGAPTLTRSRTQPILSVGLSRPRGQSVLSHHSIIEPSYNVFKEFKYERFLLTRPLRNRFFLVMLLIMLMHGIGWYAVMTHIVPFAVDFGYADNQAFDLLALIGFGSLIGCLTHGWFIDKNMISSEFAKIGSLTMLTIITLAYPAAHYSFPALATLSFVYGIAAGVSLPLFFALIRQLLPPEDVNAGVSLVIIMEMLGDTIGGVCAGLLYDQTHDYEISFFFAGGATLIATLLQLGLSWFKRRSNVRVAHTYEFADEELTEMKEGFKDRVAGGSLVPREFVIESHQNKTRGNWGPSNGNI